MCLKTHSSANMSFLCFRRRTRRPKEEDSVPADRDRVEEEDSSPDTLAQTLTDLVKTHDQKMKDNYKSDVDRRLRAAISSPKVLKSAAAKGLRSHTVQVVKTSEETSWCKEVVDEFPSEDVPPGLRVSLNRRSKLRDGGFGQKVWHECAIHW